MPLVWLIVLGGLPPSAAHAGVDVTDVADCSLNGELMELELRSVLGDHVIDEVDLRVRLSARDVPPAPPRSKGSSDAPAPAEPPALPDAPWQLSVEVADRGTILWRKVLEVRPIDCPYLTEIVILSVERGLADLPRFAPILALEPAPPVELGFLLSATLPWAVRIGMGGNLWIPTRRGVWGWDTQLELIYQAVEQLEFGAAQIVAAALGAGFGVDLPAGAHEIRITNRLDSGVHASLGLGQDIPIQVRPRLVWSGEGGLASASGIRAAFRVEINLLRSAYGSVSGPERELEPLVRGGLVLSLAGPLRRGRE